MCASVCTGASQSLGLTHDIDRTESRRERSESSTPILCLWNLFPSFSHLNVSVKCGESDKGISS